MLWHFLLFTTVIKMLVSRKFHETECGIYLLLHFGHNRFELFPRVFTLSFVNKKLTTMTLCQGTLTIK